MTEIWKTIRSADSFRQHLSVLLGLDVEVIRALSTTDALWSPRAAAVAVGNEHGLSEQHVFGAAAAMRYVAITAALTAGPSAVEEDILRAVEEGLLAVDGPPVLTWIHEICSDPQRVNALAVPTVMDAAPRYVRAGVLPRIQPILDYERRVQGFLLVADLEFASDSEDRSMRVWMTEEEMTELAQSLETALESLAGLKSELERIAPVVAIRGESSE